VIEPDYKDICNELHDKVIELWDLPGETVIGDFQREVGRLAMKLIIEKVIYPDDAPPPPTADEI